MAELQFDLRRTMNLGIFLICLGMLLMSSSTSRALVVMLSDRAAKESPLETFFLTKFSNVTKSSHSTWTIFSGGGHMKSFRKQRKVVSLSPRSRDTR
jgi:hypothetical protein